MRVNFKLIENKKMEKLEFSKSEKDHYEFKVQVNQLIYFENMYGIMSTKGGNYHKCNSPLYITKCFSRKDDVRPTFRCQKHSCQTFKNYHSWYIFRAFR
jgi:hypothetical protein